VRNTDTSRDARMGRRRWGWRLTPALLFVLIVWAFARMLPGEILDLSRLWPRVTLRASQPTLVHEIRALARLETAASSMQQVVEGERSMPPLPAWLVGDRILFVASGEAIAGVDLTGLQPDAVRVVEGRVHVRLPEPTILTVHLDEANCHVYDRTVGWFARPDPQLESRVRQRAIEEFTAAARDRGLLQTAHENAQRTIATLVRSLGGSEVVFD
jgi:Protein of unknown function (DUF4230)